MLNEVFKKHADWALIFLRFGVGIIFVVHGIGKLFNVGPTALGITNYAGFLVSLGVPAALFFAWLVAFVETVGGLFLIIGLFTRFAAIPLAIEMIVAIILVHLPNGFPVTTGGYEFPLLLLLGTITLLFSGAGKKWVLEKKMFKKEF